MKTVQEIAKIVGVSPGTVSNALNNKKGVGKETREKIIQVAEQLGYDKFTANNESKLIRLIIFKKHGYIVSDTPFFSSMIEGIERECRAEGYELLISHIIQNEASDENIKKMINDEQVSGVLLLATEMDEEDLKHFANLNLPIVLLDNYFKDSGFDFVLMNNIQGGYKAAKHLIKSGHTKIGCLKSSKSIKNFDYRYQGFISGIAEEGLSLPDDYEVLLGPTLEGAYRDMKAFLEKDKPKLPTAYFAFNDIIAIGAIKAIKENGIDVPGQISVIGFDDMPFCEISSPRLTTLRVHKQYIGITATRRLIQKISEKDNLSIKIEIDTELIERESVKIIFGG